jgi:hypothetical protein
VRFNQIRTVVHKLNWGGNMRALIISLLAAGLMAGEASAASSASLQAGGPGPRLLVLDGRVWRCNGGDCAAAGRGRSQGLIRECARVARKLGPLSAYTRDGLAFDATALARCNREARVR